MLREKLVPREIKDLRDPKVCFDVLSMTATYTKLSKPDKLTSYLLIENLSNIIS